MLRLAGEVGDGVMLWLCNPSYIREVVVPAVREGREQAGRTLDDFEIVAAVPGALTDDRGGAYDAIRGELLTYFSLPFYRTLLERSGYREDIAAFDGAQGDATAMRSAISDRFLDALTAVGDEDAVRAGWSNTGMPESACHAWARFPGRISRAPCARRRRPGDLAGRADPRHVAAGGRRIGQSQLDGREHDRAVNRAQTLRLAVYGRF